MNTPIHLSTNTVIGLVLYYKFNTDLKTTLAFIIWGTFLDIDHLFYLAIKYKTLNIKKWISPWKKLRKNMQAQLYIFHSPEFNSFLIILSLINKFFIIILLASVIHIILDTIEHYQFHQNFKWIKNWSIIYNLLNSKNSSSLEPKT
jgi:hypothetical protein